MRAKVCFAGAEPVCAAVYICSVSAALMYVVARTQALICTLAMTALSFGVYMLFYALRRRKGFSFLAAAAVGAVCMAALGAMRFPRSPDGTFLDFVFTASEFFDPVYAAVTILLFSAVVGFMCCFFSAYSPRPCFLMLIMFIPLILSVRTAGGIPLPLLAFMLCGFALVTGSMAMPEIPSECVYADDRGARRERLIAIALAGAAAAGITAFIPRSENTPMGGYLDTVFSGSTGGYYAAAQQLTNFRVQSSVNRGANEPTGTVLFTAAGQVPRYIDRASFDVYKGGTNGWTGMEQFDTGYSGWEATARFASPSVFANRLREAAAEGGLEKYADILGKIPEQDDGEKIMFIQVVDGSSTAVILHPDSVFRVSPTTYHGRLYKNPRGDLFAAENLPANAGYKLEYYGGLTDEAALALSGADYEELLSDARDEGVLMYTEYSSLEYMRSEAEEYKNATYPRGEMPQKIRELAAEITAGLDTDYEKAAAIEKWFGDAGFVYDMDFVPAETDAEYFLFESRRGICSDFATAAALLARAAGLSVRYTEGFLITDDIFNAETGIYYVTDAQYHAYARVFAGAAGSIVIDGTKYALTPESSQGYAWIWAVSAATAAVLVIIFRRQISALFFLMTYPVRSADGKIKGVFLRTRALAGRVCGRAPENMTVGETAQVIARSLGMKEQAEYICTAADALLYGGGAQADGKLLLRSYRRICRQKRRMKK